MSEQVQVQVRLPGREVTKDAELTFSEAESTLTLSEYEFLEKSAQLKIQRSGKNVTIGYGNRAGMVKDYVPRTLWVTYQAEPVTLLDAKMSIDNRSLFRGPQQKYSASRVLYGVHLDSTEHPVDGIRFTLSIKAWHGWLKQEPAPFSRGTVGPWERENGVVGVEVMLHEPEAVGRIENHTLIPLRALAQLWMSEDVEEGCTEVHVPGSGWHAFHAFAHMGATKGPWSGFLPLGELKAETLAAWLDTAGRLGPIPYMALHRTGVIQVDALLLGTALEGCHRRLVRGLVDKEKKIPYRARVSELVNNVKDLVPGLFGPDVADWTAAMRDIRNEQGHVFANVDNFDEAHVSRYYVHHVGADWLLRLSLLLEVVDRNLLATALEDCDRFRFALANMDREEYWPNHSSYDEFQNATTRVAASRQGGRICETG